MTKVITLFLIGMAVLAMFGRLRIPGKGGGKKLSKPRRCRSCGKFLIGKGGCDCDSRKS